jgi:hypothetical protein
MPREINARRSSLLSRGCNTGESPPKLLIQVKRFGSTEDHQPNGLKALTRFQAGEPSHRTVDRKYHLQHELHCRVPVIVGVADDHASNVVPDLLGAVSFRQPRKCLIQSHLHFIGLSAVDDHRLLKLTGSDIRWK